MNVFQVIAAKVQAAVHAVVDGEALEPGKIEQLGVELPRDPSHGDLATNAAMMLAKPLRQKPRALAEKIVAELRKDPAIASAEVAGPGFVN